MESKKAINVTIWNEQEEAIGPYPQGIHNAIADFLKETKEFGVVRTAILPQKEHGLTEEVLADTDVLLWWGHMYHHLVEDEIVERVRKRVLDGMGLLVLHSAHAAKIFSNLLGTDASKLRWRESDEYERVWTLEPNHPIAQGVPEYIDIPESEMYGEVFQIPTPDELIFLSWYNGGEVFRSGCTFKRGNGRIFFFSPGHESFPIYNMPAIQKIIVNGIKWAAPTHYAQVTTGHTPEYVHKM